MKIDLDAAKRARLEAIKEKHKLHFGGKDFPLPPELPWSFAEAIADGNVKDALRGILNSRYEEFRKLEPSTNDLQAFVAEIAKLYAGVELGESSASDSS